MIGTFQQVLRPDIDARLAEGWTIAEDLYRPTHHNFYSVLMKAPEPEGLQPIGTIAARIISRLKGATE